MKIIFPLVKAENLAAVRSGQTLEASESDRDESNIIARGLSSGNMGEAHHPQTA